MSLFIRNEMLSLGSCFISTSFIFLAPDQNPTGVQGFGTEHDNLVISWKVINMYFYKRTCCNPEVVTFIPRERALISFCVMKL